MIRKVALTVFCIFIFIDSCYSQLSGYNLTRLNERSIKISKHYYVKYARRRGEFKLTSLTERRNLDFVPIISFKLKKAAVNYDENSKIVDFVKRHTKSKITEAIYSKEGVFEGSLHCLDLVYGYSKFCECLGNSDFRSNYQHTVSRNLYWFIQSEMPDFLFEIKMIRGLFYIKEDKVYFIDMYEKMLSVDYKNGTTTIYDPDQFIRDKCSIEIIREIARNKKGSVIRFCN